MKGTARLLLSVCIALAAHASSVTLRIAADPDAQLPGLAPVLRVWVTNHGSTPAEVPTRVALRVVPPAGEPFFAYAQLRDDVRTLELVSKKPLIVGAGETQDLSFWSRDDWFGADGRFRAIGVFRLQLVADDRLDPAAPAILGASGTIEPLLSNETVLTMVEPTGVDLAVWTAMKEDDEICSAAITQLIWQQYPGSRYAAYCVRDRNDADELKQIAGYEASLAMNPPAYWADAYRLNIADAWISRGSQLVEESVDAAVDAYDRARSILEPLSRKALAPTHRREAARYLESRVRDRKQVVALHNSLHGEAGDDAILFGVTCSETLPGGARKVWFGYNNPASEPIDLPVGKDNKFTPAPFDRNQPTRLMPGHFVFAFPVITKEPVLTWHLQGKTGQFKAGETRECPKGYDPDDPETWQVEE